MGKGSYTGGSSIIHVCRTPKPEIERGKIALVERVISSRLKDGSLPDVPKNLSKIIDYEIIISGGLFNWAKSHPQYEKLLRAIKRKLNRKISNKKNHASFKNISKEKNSARKKPAECIYKAVDKRPDGAEVTLVSTGAILLTTTISSDESWWELVDLVLLLNTRELKRMTQVEGRMRDCKERANVVR